MVPIAEQLLRPLHASLRGHHAPPLPKGLGAQAPEDLPDAYYAYHMRDHLRKMTLVPLRLALKPPEVFISASAWRDVLYPRVASVAMKNYKDLFLEHDAERFNCYLADVKSGKAKFTAGVLLLHEILQFVNTNAVTDLQWQRMVADLLALGKLHNCLAVCNVSGSMIGLPMDVCVMLGLLLFELCDEPWHYRVITFSEQPQLHRITNETLSEKDEFIHCMNWGHEHRLPSSVRSAPPCGSPRQLAPEWMVRKVFVFNDMEFD